MIARRVNGANGQTIVLEKPVPTPLLERETWDIRLYRWYGNTLGVLVVLYLLLDRGIAHFHLPKTPAFIGELTLALGLLAIMAGTQWLRRSLEGDVLLGTLIVYMVWCFFRTVPNMHLFGIQVTVRDAALWYYAGFAIALVAACTAVPNMLQKFVQGFRVVLPLVTIWLPVALILERSGINGPKFRYSSVPLFSHKPGNICCAAAVCLAFLLLVPVKSNGNGNGNGSGNGNGKKPARFRLLRQRPYRPGIWVTLIVINVFTMLLGATQTRGGALAELIAVLLMFCLMERTRRSRTIVAFVAGLALVVGFGLVTNATYHTQKRTISVSQLFQNASSVTGGGSANSQLSGSVNFRFDLWGNILSKQETTSHLINGFGFGPNLARTGGLNPRPNQPATLQLRSAHNSWLDIFARTGIIGTLLLLVVWLGWFRRMGMAHRRARDDEIRGVIGVAMVGCLAIWLNSFFDPTLEGAQVAAVLFTLFALGIVAARQSQSFGRNFPTEPVTVELPAASPAALTA
jgi:O-antigen ligase